MLLPYFVLQNYGSQSLQTKISIDLASIKFHSETIKAVHRQYLSSWMELSNGRLAS